MSPHPRRSDGRGPSFSPTAISRKASLTTRWRACSVKDSRCCVNMEWIHGVSAGKAGHEKIVRQNSVDGTHFGLRNALA